MVIHDVNKHPRRPHKAHSSQHRVSQAQVTMATVTIATCLVVRARLTLHNRCIQFNFNNEREDQWSSSSSNFKGNDGRSNLHS